MHGLRHPSRAEKPLEHLLLPASRSPARGGGGGVSPVGARAQLREGRSLWTRHPAARPLVHTEELGLFTVFWLVAPCRAEPTPGTSCFLGGCHRPSPAGTGVGVRGALTRTGEVPRTPGCGWSLHTSLRSVPIHSEARVTRRWPSDMPGWAQSVCRKQKLEVWLLSNVRRDQ